MLLLWLILYRWWCYQLRCRSSKIRLLASMFIIGIMIGHLVVLNHFLIFCIALLLLFVSFVSTNLNIKWIFLSVCIVSVGVWRYQIVLPQYDDPHFIYAYHDQKVIFEGVVVEVQERIDQQKMVVATQRLFKSRTQKPVKGRVLTSVSLWPQFNYGDVVRVACTLKRPPKWDDFDYSQYLARSNIYVICNFAQVDKIGSGAANPLYAAIYSGRRYLQQRLHRTMSEPQVSIIEGMILGTAYGIPRDVQNQFSALGLTHIIAISGSHIVIMVSLCMLIAVSLRIRRQCAFIFAVIIVFVYIILVGAPASAIRAGIMGIIVLLAQQVSRRHRPLHTLLLTAVLMLTVNPQLLAMDIGFQLSFAAVFGLLVIAPILEDWWRRVPNILEIRTIMSMTLAAQLATLPIILFHFHQLSPWSIFANILILPIIPFMTVYALIHVLIAGLSITLGSIMAWGTWTMVSYWLLITALFSKLPFVTIFFDEIWLSVSFLISCAVVAYFILCYRRRL